MRRFRHKAVLLLIIALLCAFAYGQDPLTQAAPGPAPDEVQPPAAAAPSAAAQLTPEDLGAFLDGLIPVEIERRDIAGCVVVVVKDGEILFAKGYGFADVEKKQPVSDSETLFRPGSISKLFTWTAIMQLVEQDKLDLDKDVNDYLDFRIPATYPQPITLRNIMTHTPGFEETVKDLFVAEEVQLMPLRDYLTGHLPQRIFPPGAVPAYSNYATTLAGYIVQVVSGMKFEDYIDQFIFQPLGMTRATFLQPLPAELKPLMSNGYQLASGKSKPFEFVAANPAGALTVSGRDIARFMIAHLQDGEFQGQRILRPETARLMHSRQFALSPELNGMALGFYEESRNGHRIIGHGGDTQWFHSDLHLMADQNLGFFVSYNSAGKGDGSARAALWEGVLDRYYPYTPPPPAEGITGSGTGISGTYLVSRRMETSFLRLMSILGEFSVSDGPDGTIVVPALKGFNGQPKKFREVAPLVYREVNGQEKVAFIRNPAGGYTVGIMFPAMALQPISWYQHKNFVLSVLLGAVGVFALTLIFWPVALLVRRHYGQRLELSSADRRFRLAVRLVCAFVVAALASWALVFAVGMEGVPTARMDPWIRLAQFVTLLALLASLLPIYNAFRSWSRPRWWWTRIWDTVVALACIGFIWIVFFGNFLQWRLSY